MIFYSLCYTLCDGRLFTFCGLPNKNGGISKHVSENSESVTKEEVDYLVENTEILQNIIQEDLLII